MNDKPFIFAQWHAWEGTWEFMLSNELEKRLRSFKTVDEAINWLYGCGYKDAARALHKHYKGN